MPRRTSDDRAAGGRTREGIPAKLVILTLDNHMASAVDRAAVRLRGELPGMELVMHALTDWNSDPDAEERCRRDIADADFIIANMLFLDEHIRKVEPWLQARRDDCDCLIGCMSAAEIVRLTRIGDLDMSKPAGGVLGLLKRLRGKAGKNGSAGRGQMKMLRSIPRLLKYIPGKAQHVRSYFLVLQYLLASSDENIVNLVRYLVSGYAKGPREALRRLPRPAEPIEYPETGIYHPDLPGRVGEDLRQLGKIAAQTRSGQPEAGTVGLLIMRSYVLSDNAAHYDGVIREFEARGLRVIPAFASGLDARPAIDRFFKVNDRAIVDCVVSLTGFSLVGGPAYNDSMAAAEALAGLDVPYLSAFATEFQTMAEWKAGEQGLTPVEATIMVSLPEIDGASGPILFGGRVAGAGGGGQRAGAARDMAVEPERAAMLAERVARLVSLRRKERAQRRVAVVLYNFPPNGGATGTAAYLDVFASLHNTLLALRSEGYCVEVPSGVEELREAILGGNSEINGMPANVAARIDADSHVRGTPWLEEIEAQWGPAPGRQQSDGRNILVLGRHFGNVFVGIQPAFGYEGDPMRLLFERGFAPTHAFSAFYRYLEMDFQADAVIHFGTHGALEFMPGKQVGLSGECWPDRLIGALPNFYIYAANNPSEGTIAKRRSAATLISHMTPPVAKAGLYRGLADLKHTIDRWRALPPGEIDERRRLEPVIRDQAAQLDLIDENAAWPDMAESEIRKLATEVAEFEAALIPHGLHIIGAAVPAEHRLDLLRAVNEGMGEEALEDDAVSAIAAGRIPANSGESAAMLARLATEMATDSEVPAILAALDGRFIRPVSGGDILRSPDVMPTGRNIHGFDPFRLPSAFAVEDGRRQADRIIERHLRDHGTLPRRIAMVLWGTDNLKSEGCPIGQALWLVGARPRFDSFGRLAGAQLVPLAELGRPRIDVVITLSGIFRDLLPLQTRLLAEASLLAAQADEPEAMNPIRAHVLAYAREHDCAFETAALRVFSNAAGAYGSNVNMLIDSSAWDEEDELAETYSRRKCFAYGRDGRPVQQHGLLQSVLSGVDAAYQNIESLELGVTSIDHYFDTLGGISRAIRKSGGRDVPIYIGDQTTGSGKVRSLEEQVALETRTRMLNPKWYEALLKHGYEGVRNIESHVTNTLGWSATTGRVQPWIYKNLAETFILDDAMRRRLSELNPKASAKLANRLIEARDRDFWAPDDATWKALCLAGAEIEDRVEGIPAEAAE